MLQNCVRHCPMARLRSAHAGGDRHPDPLVRCAARVRKGWREFTIRFEKSEVLPEVDSSDEREAALRRCEWEERRRVWSPGTVFYS